MVLVAHHPKSTTAAGSDSSYFPTTVNTCGESNIWTLVVGPIADIATGELETFETYVLYQDSRLGLRSTGLLVEKKERNRHDEVIGAEVLNQSSLQESVAREFSQIESVVGVYLYPIKGGCEINTVLSTRERVTRDAIYSKQLTIHDKFPGRAIHFTMSFSSEPFDLKDLPDDTIVCFRR